jgi:hypothetical protein
MALRKLGVIPVGGQPHVDQLDMGLAAVRELFAQWATSGIFGRLGGVCPEPESVPIYAPDLTLLRVTDTNSTLLFDRFINGWWDLNDFTLDGDAPLSERGVDGLACCVAERLSETLAAPMGPITIRGAQDFKNNLAWKFGMEREPLEGQFS